MSETDAPDSDGEDLDLTGRRIGAYRLERLLGRGGMGAVYLASRDDGEFTRHVAVKFIRPSMVSPALLKRFRLERQLLADIDHPRIARLIDGGTAEGGLPFFIMEFVPGETLSQVLARGALPPTRVIEVGISVAEVLDIVHSKGLVFRDLKPSNIMISQESGVKVLDFGIAKIVGGASDDESTTLTLTQPGRIVGSPRYMSPEQAAGHPVDARSDIFSFGVVLFETLTGRVPFAGGSRRDYFFKLITEKPDPLPLTVPPGLRAIVERCLRKSPNERYRTGGELLNALRDLSRYSTITVRPIISRMIWTAGAALTLLVAFLIWAKRQPYSAETAVLKGPPKLVATWASNETAPRISPDLKWISFISNRDGSTRLWLVDRMSGVERAFVPPGPEVKSHEWSPSGNEIAYLAQLGIDSSLTIAPIAEGRPRVFALRQSNIELVRWIGDGIYYLANGSLWRFDLKNNAPREISTARGSLRLRSVDVSSDERHIVFSARKDSISSIWYAAIDGSNATQLTMDRIDPRYLRWKGAAGREVVYLSDEGAMVDVWQLDVATRRRQSLTRTDAREGSLDVSANGALLLYEQIREEAHLGVLDPAHKNPSVKPLTSDSLGDLLPDASASDRDVVFQRSKTLDMALGVNSASIQLSRDFFESPPVRLGEGIAPAISRDGRWVAYSAWKKPGTVAELWLIDVTKPQAMPISDALLRVAYAPFPLALTARNIVWAPEAPVLYFLAKPQNAAANVWSAEPAPEQPVKVAQVTQLADDNADLSDVQVSTTGSYLSYLLKSESRAVSELHVVDLTSKNDRVEFSEKAGFLLTSPGWTKTGEVVILRTDAGRTLTDVLLVKAGRPREAGRVRDIERGSAALDAYRQVLYFERAEGQGYSVYALSLETGLVRQVFVGAPNKPAFSGIRVLGDGRLLFSLQSQNHDISSSEFGK